MHTHIANISTYKRFPGMKRVGPFIHRVSEDVQINWDGCLELQASLYFLVSVCMPGCLSDIISADKLYDEVG